MCDSARRFRGGLVFKAHRFLYLSTLGLRVIKREDRELGARVAARVAALLTLRHQLATLLHWRGVGEACFSARNCFRTDMAQPLGENLHAPLHPQKMKRLPHRQMFD